MRVSLTAEPEVNMNGKGSCVHAQSLQSCLTLCNPMECSPPGSSVHEDSPGKNTAVGFCALLKRIFLTQGLNLCLLCLLHWQAGSLPLVPPGEPCHLYILAKYLKNMETYLQTKTCAYCSQQLCFYQPKLRGFPGGSDGKESTCSARDLGLTPGLGRSPG